MYQSNAVNAGAPTWDASGIPPPTAPGNAARQAALMNNSFGSGGFQAFLDQASQGASSAGKGGAAKAPNFMQQRTVSRLTEARTASASTVQGREPVSPPDEAAAPVEAAAKPEESEPKEVQTPQKASKPTAVRDNKLADTEGVVTTWQNLAVTDPRLMMIALATTVATTGQGGAALAEAGPNTPVETALSLDQYVAQLRANTLGGPPKEETPQQGGEMVSSEELPQVDVVANSLLNNDAGGELAARESPMEELLNQAQPHMAKAQEGPVTTFAQTMDNASQPIGGNQGAGQTSAINGKGGISHGQKTLSANAPNFTDELAGRVGRLRFISRPGMSDQVKITLDPRELGELSMKMHLDKDNKVHLMITAESEAAKELLNKQMPQLKESLARQNLGFGEVMVEVNTQSREHRQPNGAFADPQGGDETGAKERDTPFERRFSVEDLKPGERIYRSTTSSGLNVFA